MREITEAELFALFDPSVHVAIRETLAVYPDAEGLVVFECRQLDSSCRGNRSAVAVGPSNTYKSIAACEGKWLKDLPSQREYASYFWRLRCGDCDRIAREGGVEAPHPLSRELHLAGTHLCR